MFIMQRRIGFKTSKRSCASRSHSASLDVADSLGGYHLRGFSARSAPIRPWYGQWISELSWISLHKDFWWGTG
ncbi:hypothetical protein BDN71DRAFT_1442510 [Pleurotus eryngii]|uniref:Uncharacterized protein n=1 Tax=Pleurotus eryngii TaxID=5323 RepID=A0A9P6A4D1_PLEER|nr:hypothetical protein BDN71DRAFT_1442510 [Pleurotus eryngii]